MITLIMECENYNHISCFFFFFLMCAEHDNKTPVKLLLKIENCMLLFYEDGVLAGALDTTITHSRKRNVDGFATFRWDTKEKKIEKEVFYNFLSLKKKLLILFFAAFSLSLSSPFSYTFLFRNLSDLTLSPVAWEPPVFGVTFIGTSHGFDPCGEGTD